MSAGYPLNPLGPEILALLDSGMTQLAVAERLGVTKNTVSGIWARAGRNMPRGEITSMTERLDALHTTMDIVIAETRGVGRVPNVPRVVGTHSPFSERILINNRSMK